MKKGLVYKWVFGKGRDDDFDERSLPKNRFQQFCFVFRTRFGVLLKANLLCALFVLPLCVWDTICGWFVADFIKDMTAAQQMSALINLSLLRYGTDALLCVLAAVGLGGMYYVVRRLCWLQSVKVTSDFFRGVKNGWKQFAVTGLVYGIGTGLLRYLRSFSLLTLTEGNSFAWTVSVVLTVVAEVLLMCVSLFAMFEAALYNVRTGKLFTSGAILTFKRLFSTLGIALVALTPVAIWFVLPWGFLQIVGMCVVAVVGICYAVTVQTVYCLGVFDVFVNAVQYPDFVGKGLASASGETSGTTTENAVEIVAENAEENSAENVDEGANGNTPKDVDGGTCRKDVNAESSDEQTGKTNVDETQTASAESGNDTDDKGENK